MSAKPLNIPLNSYENCTVGITFHTSTLGSKTKNLTNHSRLLLRGERGEHRQGDNFSGDFFADWKVSGFISHGCVGSLKMQRNRIVDAGADTGFPQVSHQSFAIACPN